MHISRAPEQPLARITSLAVKGAAGSLLACAMAVRAARVPENWVFSVCCFHHAGGIIGILTVSWGIAVCLEAVQLLCNRIVDAGVHIKVAKDGRITCVLCQKMHAFVPVCVCVILPMDKLMRGFVTFGFNLSLSTMALMGLCA